MVYDYGRTTSGSVIQETLYRNGVRPDWIEALEPKRERRMAYVTFKRQDQADYAMQALSRSSIGSSTNGLSTGKQCGANYAFNQPRQ